MHQYNDQYYAQVHQKAAKSGRPLSELLFEDYCTGIGIDWECIPEENEAKTPDYKLAFDNQTIIAEVKEFTQNKDEREANQLMREHGRLTALHEVPGDRIRSKIKKSSPQIKARTAGRYPGLLVLCDDGRIAWHLAEYNIMTAMYGLEIVEMAIPRDISSKPYIVDRRLGPKKKMTAETNTSISAIGALVVTEPGLILKMRVYHNKFAAVPINVKLLADRGIEQYRIDIEKRQWVEY